MNETIIECQSINKEFIEGNKTLKVLTKISLEIKAGSQIAIMGPSGSGKSTLLQILGGLDLPTAGSVKILGEDIQNLDDNHRTVFRNKFLGFVYQLPNLLPEFTALENVAMPLLIANQACKIAEIKAAKALEDVGLADRLEHKPAKLSGGERQRVAIARALINNPKCILADEPTGSLDMENTKQIINLLINHSKQYGTGLVLVTHDETVANNMQSVYQLQDNILKEI